MTQHDTQRDDLDRMLSAWLDDPFTPPAPRYLPDVLEVTRRTRQRRPWPRPFIDIQSLVQRDHALRRYRTMPLPMKLALLMALTLAAATALGIASSSPPPTGPERVIVVDPSGAGDATTIAEAVAMAVTGDTVRVRPGTYAESVIVEDKDITIAGDDRDAVIVEPLPDSTIPERACPGIDPPTPCAEKSSYAFLLLEASGVLSDMTLIVSEEVWASAVIVIGQATTPTLERLTVTFGGSGFEGLPSFDFQGSTRAVLRDSLMSPSWIRTEGMTAPSYYGNTFQGTCLWDVRDGVVVQGNTITGCPNSNAMEVYGSATIAGNEIRSSSEWHPAILVRSGDETTLIEGNTIADGSAGISLQAGATATIVDNDIIDNRVGIAWQATRGEVAPLPQGNRFCGNKVEMSTPSGPLDASASNEVCAAPST